MASGAQAAGSITATTSAAGNVVGFGRVFSGLKLVNDGPSDVWLDVTTTSGATVVAGYQLKLNETLDLRAASPSRGWGGFSCAVSTSSGAGQTGTVRFLALK